MNFDPQSLGKCDGFEVGHPPGAALDLRDWGLVQLDPVTGEPSDHVRLRYFRGRSEAQTMDVCTGDVALLSLFRHGALECASILIGTGIILLGNKMPRCRMAHAPTPPLHFLCADDHTLVGDALARVFSTAGHYVEHAFTGESAWQMISANPGRFDVIIADHVMPRPNGIELVRRLRGARFTGRILVYSDALSPEEELEYRQLTITVIVENGPDSARLLAVMEAFHGSRG